MESFLDGRVVLHCGDCLDVLATLEENSIDSCVTDPPYHLTSQVATVRSAFPGRYAGTNGGAKAGFMGKQWDGGDIAFRPATWAAVLRVLKPGSYIVAFSSSRTYHRMACAIEDAGFITHPLVAWITGQGFPKAHSVSKHLDRVAGHWRGRAGSIKEETIGQSSKGTEYDRTEIGNPITDEAKQWDGWYYGTQSLKPAIEPIYVGQKPFEKGLNGTQNILKWGCGALNIDGCRVGDFDHASYVEMLKSDFANGRSGEPSANRKYSEEGSTNFAATPGPRGGSSNGRWPTNVIHDGSEEVVAGFPETQSGLLATHHSRGNKTESVYGKYAHNEQEQDFGGDSGSAARFFYSSKADSDDRLGSKHPTVKPLDLMQYLVRLITPPKGTCLDLFAGTGTTGEAAFREGLNAVLIEREPEYQDDIRRRMALVLSGPDERAREAIKGRMNGKPVDPGPLFAEPQKKIEAGESTA